MSQQKFGFLWAALSLTLLGACSGADTGGSASQRREDEQTTEGEEGAGTRTGSKASTDAGTRGAGKNSKDAGTSTRDGAIGAAAKGIPCEVSKIVEVRCATCHGATPKGAPFSLASLADFQGPSPFDDSLTMADAAYAAVTETDPRSRMPPASVDPLTKTELATLSAWLEGGAMAGAACTATDGGAEQVDGGPQPGSTDRSGGASNTELTYGDPDVKCYKLTAFASAANKSQKYSVPTTPDLYTAFNLKAPWTGTQYIKSFKSVIDNSAVLHHWLLFRQLNGGAEGVVPNALGAHPDGEMLYGWAPGGDDMWFHEDVGMQVPGNSVFQLEMHYNNRTGRPSPDASGVELCVTPNRPKHIAGLSWLGTDAIAGTRAVGTCTHSSRDKIRLIASQPHMHTKGTHMKVELARAGGAKEVIHDKPFDFNFQRAYIHNIDIMPGDKLTTTCTYSAPSTFGKGTNDEMCYFFSIHWPAGQLARQSFSSIIHGPNTCID